MAIRWREWRLCASRSGAAGADGMQSEIEACGSWQAAAQYGTPFHCNSGADSGGAGGCGFEIM
jgi:hypothetical protein